MTEQSIEWKKPSYFWDIVSLIYDEVVVIVIKISLNSNFSHLSLLVLYCPWE